MKRQFLQDKTRQDKTRQDKTRQDKTRQDKTRQDKVIVIGQMEGFDIANRVYLSLGLCPTIRTFQGGSLEPKIIEKRLDNE